MAMNQQDESKAAHLIDGYLLGLSMPKEHLLVSFDAARQDCINALTAQLEHVKSLPFEKFCEQTKRTKQVLQEDEAKGMALRYHQCIKDAWIYVNTPFVSNSAKSEVGAVVNSQIGTCTSIQLTFALQTAWPFIHGCNDQRLFQEAKTLMRYDLYRAMASNMKNQDPAPHPGGYFVMINGEQSCDHKSTLAAARLAGQVLCDAEVLPATFSIQDGDGEHIEEILRSDGRDLSAQIADFGSSHEQSEQPQG